jgi:hypothetical protein
MLAFPNVLHEDILDAVAIGIIFHIESAKQPQNRPRALSYVGH